MKPESHLDNREAWKMFHILKEEGENKQKKKRVGGFIF